MAPAGYDTRVKVMCELSNHTLYPKPEMKYYLSPVVSDFACKGEKPHYYNLLESGKKIHLNTKRDEYNLEDPEQKEFWEKLDELLRTKSTLTFYIKFWKPASEKAYARKNFEIAGDFTFDFAEAPCITM